MSALPDINIASRSLNRPHSGEYSTLRRRTTCHRRSRPALKKAMVSSAKDINSNMSIANNDGPFVPEEADVKPTINPSKAASWEAIRAEILRRSPPKDGKGVPVGGSTDIISSNDVIGSPLSPLPIRTGHCLTPPHSPSAPEIAPPPPQLHNLPGLISLLPNSHHGTNQQETT
ncbi:hypothetical protein H4Q26_004597 [Puccinia striiformis f. sp. tritici PST-130]|nr:hypothetical protein H4Q26_004597 [Puccinia striiformis f. sp. tritici PST-130]